MAVGLVIGLVALAGYFLYLDTRSGKPVRYTRTSAFTAHEPRVSQPETQRRAA
jgi:hypothetical protein